LHLVAFDKQIKFEGVVLHDAYVKYDLFSDFSEKIEALGMAIEANNDL
jgi:hypothetical protein